MSGILWPVKGSISQPFGKSQIGAEPTEYAQRDKGGWRRCRPAKFAAADGEYADFHPAVDVACPVGTAIRAPDDGVLLRRETYRIYNPFTKQYVHGLSIYFRFGDWILYADHLSKYVAAEGQHVKRGGLIGRTGNSGLSSGPHCHFECRQSTDPHASWSAYRFNPERLKTGGDLAHLVP